VDGGKNKPSTASGADGEVMLDVEVAASVAPGAKVAVYFTPNTTRVPGRDYHRGARCGQQAERDFDQLGRPGVELDRAVDDRHG